MLTETFQSIAMATRNLFRNWQFMLLIAVVYAALLAALYFFVAVREASIGQLILTFALALVSPLLFFMLQAMIASDGAADAGKVSVGSFVRKSLTTLWKLVLISLPLIALAVLIAYLLGKAQARFGAPVNDAAVELPRRMATAGARASTKPIDWRAALLSTLRYLAFGLFLPLAAIHLWLGTAREGLGAAIKRIGSLLSRAFAPQSVLIYIVGFIVFGVVPYFLLFKTTPSKHAWLEIFLLVARLAAAFALTLFGWVITVRALAYVSPNPPSHPANEAA